MSNIKNQIAQDEPEDYNAYLHARAIVNGDVDIPGDAALIDMLRELVTQLDISNGFVRDFSEWLEKMEKEATSE